MDTLDSGTFLALRLVECQVRSNGLVGIGAAAVVCGDLVLGDIGASA